MLSVTLEKIPGLSHISFSAWSNKGRVFYQLGLRYTHDNDWCTEVVELSEHREPLWLRFPEMEWALSTGSFTACSLENSRVSNAIETSTFFRHRASVSQGTKAGRGNTQGNT